MITNDDFSTMQVFQTTSNIVFFFCSHTFKFFVYHNLTIVANLHRSKNYVYFFKKICTVDSFNSLVQNYHILNKGVP